jgi:hypothetical protein
MMKRRTIPVWWGRVRPLSFLIAKCFKISGPPLLILSLPRCGSSWVGEILGSASNALYLREPLTQSILAANESSHSEIYINPITPLRSYKHFADMAFSGLPVFNRDIVKKPERWSPFDRKYKRLVIKEVNPLACEWLLQCYRPQMVFLVRHPAAVALSYLKLGWKINIREQLLNHQHLMESNLKPWEKYLLSVTNQDFWELQGAFQGAILRLVLDSIVTHSDYRIIRYEDLCANPVEIFQCLFDFVRLSWDDEVKNVISMKSSQGNVNEPYSTSRHSKEMINAWKEKLSDQEVNRLKAAYCVFDLPWYRSSEDW